MQKTGIEANANRYTFVWKKAIATNKEKMKKQLTDIWLYAQSVAADEDNLPEPPDFTTIDTEKVKATVDKLNEVLSKNTLVDKKVKAKLQYVTKNYPANIKNMKIRKLFWESATVTAKQIQTQRLCV